MDYCYKWKKGDFARNPRMIEEWGVGIVTEDQRDDTVKLFFENTSSVKTIIGDMLEEVADPGLARTYLEHALVDEEVAAKYDREPFPSVLKRFLEDFPEGFKGEWYTGQEREYKVAAVEWAAEHLNEESWKGYLDTKRYEELAQEIRRFYSKLNLLASFEMIKLNDALKNPEAQKAVGKAMFDLVYGQDSMKSRFESTARILERYDIGKWPIITYPLFVLLPDQYMFVKPEMTKEAAANRGFDIGYDSQLNWNTYERVMLFAQDLKERLLASDNPHLHPEDMIDIQGFMWCTFTKGYSAADHQARTL
ncbi:hypothetical protein [Pseudohalioglobus lutimaris]|uniref:Uncharacterized protein n=1 Tax=Pseudohalioglobus lutimaris TaxID=1737061 RepID=A0A2N5WXE3_9GAMM|nr:hypothetical protein [Pseudohalioglobus lutimaris]PLW66896.1 hypothetical protein C0039_19540 [Pseudohalioglobus lutimaris]